MFLFEKYTTLAYKNRLHVIPEAVGSWNHIALCHMVSCPRVFIKNTLCIEVGLRERLDRPWWTATTRQPEGTVTRRPGHDVDDTVRPRGTVVGS